MILEKKQELDLGSNRIAEIEEDNLQGLISLTHLYLFNNSIYQIDMGTFEATPQLQELQLGKNLLIEVPLALGRLFKLRYLDLSNNQIRTSSSTVVCFGTLKIIPEYIRYL
uniref:LRRCT domain-containing protein n=1 Tax=Elaeophora elaphi TaxID=1147741 RepID=A0A0R3RKX8_9BILA